MDALLNYAVSTLIFDDEQNNDPSTAEMWDRRLWWWREGEDKGHHLRQQWRSSMSSDQHFSPPRFCFTLLITGSPLTTDKNYSSKTCGRCARRALYNVRYNPLPPPHRQGPLAKQLHFFHGFDCPCDSSPALDNIIILSCTKERMCVPAACFIDEEHGPGPVCKRQAFEKCLLFGRSGKWRYCLNRMTKGNAIWNSFVVLKNPSVLLLNNISLTRKYIPLVFHQS